MSPAHLKILLHYFTEIDDHPRVLGDSTLLGAFVRDGLLEINNGRGPQEADYRITEKGIVFIQHVLSVPLPKQLWVRGDALT